MYGVIKRGYALLSPFGRGRKEGGEWRAEDCSSLSGLGVILLLGTDRFKGGKEKKALFLGTAVGMAENNK